MGGGEIFGFGGESYKESRPWCSLLVGFPSLVVAPSGEKLTLLMCSKKSQNAPRPSEHPPVRGGGGNVKTFRWDQSLSTISRVFVPIFFFGQRVVVDVEGVGFRPKAVVAGRGFVAVCTRISSQEYVLR